MFFYLIVFFFFIYIASRSFSSWHKTQNHDKTDVSRVKPFYTKIRGVTFANRDGTDRQKLIQELKQGETLKLVRDLDATDSETAIMICSEKGTLGYVAGKHSQGIAPIMDEGYAVSAIVKNVTGGSAGNPVGCNIEIIGIRVIEDYDQEDAELAEEFGEKYEPTKKYYPRGEKQKTPIPTEEPKLPMKVESRLAMEIPPWEKNEEVPGSTFNQ